MYVATRRPGDPPEIAYFEFEKLSAGHAKRCTNTSGTALVSYGRPESTTVRVVDPETLTECPAATTGEIWVHGEQVAAGYWQKPQESERDEEAKARFDAIKRDITSAISKSHGLTVADLVLVGPGSIPITTSGKIRRSTCVEQYRHDQFTRLDV